MEKCITLSLLILISTCIQAMKSNELNQTPNESKLILNIRAKKAEFENQLLDDAWKNEGIDYNSNISLSRFWTDNFEPINFLRSCYYKFHHKMTIFKLKTSSSLLNISQNTQIDGYSALSAAILANDISHDVKHNLIQELINLNFKPTPNDIELAELILYDEIAKQQETIRYFLNASSNYWFVLPEEIRKQIIEYTVQLFKKRSWLLPEKSTQEEEDINYCLDHGILK